MKVYIYVCVYTCVWIVCIRSNGRARALGKCIYHAALIRANTRRSASLNNSNNKSSSSLVRTNAYTHDWIVNFAQSLTSISIPANITERASEGAYQFISYTARRTFVSHLLPAYIHTSHVAPLSNLANLYLILQLSTLYYAASERHWSK